MTNWNPILDRQIISDRERNSGGVSDLAARKPPSREFHRDRDRDRFNVRDTTLKEKVATRGPVSVAIAIEQLKNMRDVQRQETLAQLEMKWLSENKIRYAGHWVALQGDRLVAEGKSGSEVYEKIRGQKPAPLVVQLESHPLPFFAGW
jgi:hypothetical protein